MHADPAVGFGTSPLERGLRGIFLDAGEIEPGAAVTADTPGFCYLHAVVPEARVKMKKALGINPYLAAVIAWLSVNRGVQSGGKFRLTLGHEMVDMPGDAFVQAHLEPHDAGVKLKSAFAVSCVDVRLGATNVPVQAPHAGDVVGQPSVMHTPHRSTLRINVPFAFAVDNTSPAFTFGPRQNAHVSYVTQYFESVQLVSASMQVHVAGGPDAICRAVITNTGVPFGNLAWVSGPYSMIAGGNAQGPTTTLFELPADHPFGREIKAPFLGNADPQFHFLFTSSTPSYCFGKGNMVLDVSGSGTPNAFNVGPAKIARSPVARQVPGQAAYENPFPDGDDSDDEPVPEASRAPTVQRVSSPNIARRN